MTLPTLSFSSEADLRQALVSLFVKMPGISKVQLRHGTLERGADITFEESGGLLGPVHCGCVIKNVQIVGAVDSSTGARNVYSQAEQVLDTPRVDERGEEVRFGKVYIVTPYPIGDHAVESIRGKLGSRGGQVSFVAGPTLRHLFSQHWSEFLDTLASATSNSNGTIVPVGAELQAVAARHRDVVGSSQAWAPYVHQAMHCHMAVFDVAALLALAPESKDVRGQHTLGSVQVLLERLRHLDMNLTQLAAWQVLDPSTVRRVTDRHSLLAETLRKEWERAAGASVADLASDHSGVVKLADLADNDTTTTALANAREALNECLEQLRPFSSSEARSYFSQPSLSVDDVSVAAARLASWLPFAFRSAQLELRGLTTTISLEGGTAALAAFAPGKHLVVMGGAGFGKSSLCRRRVLEDAQVRSHGSPAPRTLLIPLRNYPTGELPELSDAFIEAHEAQAKPRKKTPRSRTGFRLLLDGLDEIASEEARDRIVRWAKQLADSEPTTQIVMTCRPNFESSSMSWMTRVELSKLSDDDWHNLALEWLNGDEQEVATLNRRLKLSPGLDALRCVPLLGVLMLLTYKNTKKLETSRAGLYGAFTDLLAGGWDLVREVNRGSKFSVETKLLALRKLAWLLQDAKMIHFESAAAKSACKGLAEVQRSEHSALLEELVTDGLLSRDGQQYQFWHQSLQEYLASCALSSDVSGDKAKIVLAAYLRGDSWWEGVLDFFVSEVRHGADAARLMAAVAVDLTPANVSMEAYRRLWKVVEAAHPAETLGAAEPSLPGYFFRLSK